MTGRGGEHLEVGGEGGNFQKQIENPKCEQNVRHYQKMLTSKLLKTIRKGRVGSREDRKEEASLSDNLVSVKKCSISLITHISQKHLIF